MVRRPRRSTPDPAEMRLWIGANVRRLRTDRGWTQGELAERIGVKTARVSDFERGTRDPRIATILRFARALNVTVDELLTRS